MRSPEDEEWRQSFVWPAQPRAREVPFCAMPVTRPCTLRAHPIGGYHRQADGPCGCSLSCDTGLPVSVRCVVDDSRRPLVSPPPPGHPPLSSPCTEWDARQKPRSDLCGSWGGRGRFRWRGRKRVPGLRALLVGEGLRLARPQGMRHRPCGPWRAGPYRGAGLFRFFPRPAALRGAPGLSPSPRARLGPRARVRKVWGLRWGRVLPPGCRLSSGASARANVRGCCPPGIKRPSLAHGPTCGGPIGQFLPLSGSPGS